MKTITVEEFKVPEKFKEKNEPPKNTKFVYSLVSPAVIIFVLVILFPIIIGIFISFRLGFTAGYPFGERFTLTNYYQLLTYGNYNTRNFWQYTYQTLFFSVVSLSLEFLLGLLFAMLLNKKFKGRGIARATLLIPWAVPTVASATLFRFEIFNTAEEYGLINSLLIIFGWQPINFFGSGLAPVLFNLPVFIPYAPYISEIPITMTMFTAIIIDVWKTTPFITLLILAALQIVPEDLTKAGEIAGASGWQKFRYIIWPLIKPGIGIALIFRMMQALRVYDAIVVFKDSSVHSMTLQAVNLWLNNDQGLASAISIMILLFVLLFAAFILLVTRREERKSSRPKSILSKIFRRGRSSSRDTNFLNSNNNETNSELGKLKVSNNQTTEQEDLDFGLTRMKIEPISEAKMRIYKIRRVLKKWIFALLVIFMCLFCAGPFLWIVLKSFRDPYVIQTQPEILQTLSYGFYPLIITIIFGIIISLVHSKTKSSVMKWVTTAILIIDAIIFLILPYILHLGPKLFSFGAYQVIFQSKAIYGITFDRALLNGVLLAGMSVILVIVVGSLIAYAIAKFNFRGKRGLNGFIFSMNSLPPLIVIIPFYIQTIIFANLIIPTIIYTAGYLLIAYLIIWVDRLKWKMLNWRKGKINKLLIIGLLLGYILFYFILFPYLQALGQILPSMDLRDNILGLVLPYTAFNLPLAVFILIAFFKEIPEDLWKAAKVDGASNFQIFRKVILPLTVPGIFTCAILVFIAGWNELLFAQIFLTSPINQTVPVSILRYVRNPANLTAPWNTDIALMAATSISTIPLIIVVLIFQKRIVSGLTRGAVKG